MTSVAAPMCLAETAIPVDATCCAGYAAPPSDSGSTIAPSTPMSTRSSTSGMSTQSSARSYRRDVSTGISWHSMRLGHRIQPSVKYAHQVSDVYLLSCFLDLAQVQDISCESTKLLFRTVKMLRACDFSTEDICSILAHASAYFVEVYKSCGDGMDANEVGNVLALLIFLAHSYVLDETCRLKVWHKYLFSKYCSLEMLSSAVMRLMEVLGYLLRVADEDLKQRYTSLLRASAPRHLPPRVGLDGCSCSTSPTSPALPSPCSSISSRLSGKSGTGSESSSSYCCSDGELSTSTVRALGFA